RGLEGLAGNHRIGLSGRGVRADVGGDPVQLVERVRPAPRAGPSAVDQRAVDVEQHHRRHRHGRRHVVSNSTARAGPPSPSTILSGSTAKVYSPGSTSPRSSPSTMTTPFESSSTCVGCHGAPFASIDRKSTPNSLMPAATTHVAPSGERHTYSSGNLAGKWRQI